MSKGYFILAQNSDINYVRHAYALALSIKTKCEINEVAIAVTPGHKIDDRYEWVFDHIYELPWMDLAKRSKRKFENDWKCIHLTPFDETIKIEADMLVTSSLDNWWDNFDAMDRDVLFTSKVHDYKGNLITSRACRRLFDEQHLPDIYNGVMYFRKNGPAFSYFRMAEAVFRYWKDLYEEYMDYRKPDYIATDDAYALAAKLSGFDELIYDKELSFPTFTHMKFELTDLKLKYDNWLSAVPTILDDDLDLYVGNYKQYLPFHYHEKDFLTDEIIEAYEAKI